MSEPAAQFHYDGSPGSDHGIDGFSRAYLEAWDRYLRNGIPESATDSPRLDRPALLRHHAAKRRTVKLQRAMAWADTDAIKAIYAEAHRRTRETGIPHHVDHEIPLQGRLVSGLHVHNNLQILTGSENSKKRNRFEIEL